MANNDSAPKKLVPSWLGRWQSRIQGSLCPALWIPYIRDFHSAKSSWTIDAVSVHDSLAAVRVGLADLHGQYLFEKMEIQNVDDVERVCVYFWTKHAEWLDVVHIGFDKTSDGVAINASCGGTGIVPLTVPFAPLFNIALCWFPFLDKDPSRPTVRTCKARLDAIERVVRVQSRE